MKSIKLNISSLLLLSLIIISVSTLSQSLVCPDASKCRDGMTCCKWSTGKYGCCPLDSAQCCSDGLHCCPHNLKCNDKEGTCDEPIVERKSLFVGNHSGVEDIKDVVCPGGEYQCPDGNTCCPMSGQRWGCCPLQNAVCCSDQIHCCPSGTTCVPNGCRV